MNHFPRKSIIALLGLCLSVMTSSAKAQSAGDIKTNLSFDGSVVEMTNRNAKDMTSMTTVGMDNSGKRQALFQKKEHFRPEIQQNLKMMGETP